jgi:hypothetical protein
MSHRKAKHERKFTVQTQPNQNGGGQAGIPVLLDVGEGLYLVPAAVQMVMAIEVLAGPTGQKGNLDAGAVVIKLRFISGGEMELSPEQSNKFLITIGVRRPLVEVASGAFSDQLRRP